MYFFHIKMVHPLYFSAVFDAPDDSLFLDNVFRSVSIDEKIHQVPILFGALNASKAVLQAVLKYNPNIHHQIHLSRGRIGAFFDFKGLYYEPSIENSLTEYFYTILTIAAAIGNNDAVETLITFAKASSTPFSKDDIMHALSIMETLAIEEKLSRLTQSKTPPEHLVHTENLQTLQEVMDRACKREFEPDKQRTKMLLVGELLRLDPNIGFFHYVQMNFTQRMELDIEPERLVNNLDLETRDFHGRTILMVAAQNYPDLVATILNNNPDIRATVNNNDGDTMHTALDLAARVGAADSVSALLEHANNIAQPYTEEEKQQALQAIEPFANIDKPKNFQPDYDQVRSLLGGVSEQDFELKTLA